MASPAASAAKRSDAVRLLAIVTGTALILILFYPHFRALAARMIPPCFLLTFTGLRCPLCGGTRCVGALVRLDIAQAFYYNPMVVICCAICAYLYIRLAISCCAREYVPYRPRVGSRAWLWLLGAYLIFFIVRNTPFYQMYLY